MFEVESKRMTENQTLRDEGWCQGRELYERRGHGNDPGLEKCLTVGKPHGVTNNWERARA